MEEKKRITVVVGAGAILDFDLPEGVQKPSTKFITDEVIRIKETNSISGTVITEIAEIYNVLNKEYPVEPNFEMLFHVIEMWYAYGYVWKDPINLPKNPEMYPVFAPFVSPKQGMDVESVRQATHHFLLKVMDIINSYNAPYLADESFNKWYRDFWRDYGGCWDVFNLNYDTTIEHSLDHCEDGFEGIPGQKDFQHFVPQKLWENVNGWSTMSHLHGCIEFFDERYEKDVYEKEVLKYDFHDMYKYESYEKVRERFSGSWKSLRSNQAGEQLICTPIITGLRKNDKLNIVPFDFYHGHLFNSILKNNSLLLVGYSFGDVYMNHVIERMELIHGDSKRIVLIDWWPLHVDEKIAGITDSEQMGCIKSMMQQRVRDTDFNKELGYFLCRMTGKTQFDEAVTCFKNYDRIGPMVSLNGCLMLFIGGFKAAAGYKDKIYDFLNS
jgi:hypothetical protein